MKKFLLLVTIVLVALAVTYHDRIFLRDPLGKVTRDDVAIPDARVFINYSNDILVQEYGGRHMLVVQNYNRLPGSPTGLSCLQGMICITPSDQAVPGAANLSTQAAMSNREVSFVDVLGSHVHVQIR